MLDITFIRENPDKVREAASSKGISIDVDNLLKIDENRRNMIQEVDALRAKQNKASLDIASLSGKERDKKIAESKKFKSKLEKAEKQLKSTQEVFFELMAVVPNIPFAEVPVGGESDNKVLRKKGVPTKFKFKPKDHLQLGEALDVIDVKRAAKVSGSRFQYLKGDLALLEFALINFAMDIARKDGFIPIIPPVLIKPESMQKMGYIDTPEDAEERYFFEKDNLFLVGTAEQSIGPMHAKEVFERKDLPKRYVGFSTCFREEAGSYGRDTRGILRVHQFDKVELFSFCNSKDSQKEHKLLVAVAEKLWQALKIPYQVVQLATGDMARPSASTIDIEVWLPGQEKYREAGSAYNTTDFQSRRLNIRFKNTEGDLEFVHMLNGTGLAIGRTLIAILENYQTKEGSVKIPSVLQKYIGIKEIKPAS